MKVLVSFSKHSALVFQFVVVRDTNFTRDNIFFELLEFFNLAFINELFVEFVYGIVDAVVVEAEDVYSA